MNTLGHINYMGEKDSPAHWSGPAQRYLESLERLNGDLAVALNRVPDPTREAIAALHAMTLQIMRMVSENVILGMVRDEFWKQYAQVPITTESALKIINRLIEELGDRELRLLINDATEQKVEKQEVA